MTNNDFNRVLIHPRRYCNDKPLYGFIESNRLYATDTPYYPYLPSHDRIIKKIDNFGSNFKNLFCKQLIFSVPYDRINCDANEYNLVSILQSFKTTLVTCWLIQKDSIKNVNSYYTIKENGALQLLSEFANKNNLRSNTLVINGGFFITPNLIYDSDKSKNWSFEKRFSEFKLPANLSPYYGFYYVRN